MQVVWIRNGIISSDCFEFKPMVIEEAALQLEKEKMVFGIFFILKLSE